MSDTEKFGLVILASGLSQRFGNQDKLLAPYHGQALAMQTANLSKAREFAACVCVLRPNCPELEKIFSSLAIELVTNSHSELGQGHSLALGIEFIAQKECNYAFVVLADMPLVSSAHLEMLLTQIGEEEAAIAFDGQRRSPPALFRRSMFPKLINQTGDTGAKEVLRASRSVKNVTMPENILFDVDTPDDLRRAEEILPTAN